MRIFNTMSRQKEEFIPIKEKQVGIYVCGPTVYNKIHIGNARPMIVFDTVRRYFEHKGYQVNYVSNFTDVDDKIIRVALEEGVPAEEISHRYMEECRKDMQALNVREATSHPLATEEMEGIIQMVQTLIDKGYAYPVADGTVYYRTRKFNGYGKLSHKNIDDLEAGHRDIKVTGDLKEDPLDFVLWKPKKEGEPYWESPWCQGRPGWHIECSCMSKKYLGEEIDIHAGGEDLIFPHHENEIAQSEAANGKTFAHYWMHNGMINVDNKKMSKSVGNFFLVQDILKEYDPQVLRFFVLSAQYRSPLNFSAALMEAAKNGLDRILTATDHLQDLQAKPNEKAWSDSEQLNQREVSALQKKFDAAMDDDFNTADAISVIFELVRLSNSTTDENSSTEYVTMLLDAITGLADILGIKAVKEEEILESEIEELIQERQDARKNKNFARADEIRDLLIQKGILLEDTREGVKWKKA